MKKLEIIDGIVVNSILVDPNNIPDWCADWPSDEELPNVGINDELVDGVWVKNTQRPAYMEPLVRQRRDDLLVEMDAVVSNPLRWASLTEEQQQAWADYRQALLDVPQQEGFPTNVTWPELS